MMLRDLTDRQLGAALIGVALVVAAAADLTGHPGNSFCDAAFFGAGYGFALRQRR